ncbi:hypothetical protein CONPUDRAFT_156567 [Coniophora puteana RWD-64-598 SS2]|uniref:Uncharacterized protein n=1 Tax=Coniophora puteana (strain RWD-64-598) TaxID=741705 RepID=A0A5M3MHA1_CONPW|nr:uncharacterized protein CONPUDRAFT_156567 [Coniophora puteana RWD-64-598 SS2]EIW78592.1 hypothetical protein CONPUDRAFT_156567 [Coniophora puteana RWD-64-598 SS2]
MSGGDPRSSAAVSSAGGSKPRLPKAYTDDQLNFLRGHVQGFESRTRGAVRGDAKKFALERADEFLMTFGMPDDLRGTEEAEPRFREQIYNWYKNTVGRARRKMEGRTRGKGAGTGTGTKGVGGMDKMSGSPAATHSGLTWSPNLSSAVSYHDQTQQHDSPASQAGPSAGQQQQQQHGGQQQHGQHQQHGHTQQQQHQHGQQQQQQQQQQSQYHYPFQTHSALSVPSPGPSALSLGVGSMGSPTPPLRDAFLASSSIDAGTLSQLIQQYALSHPSAAPATPLAPVVQALFDAATAILAGAGGGSHHSSHGHGHGHAHSQRHGGGASGGTTSSSNLHALLRRYADACAFFPPNVAHAGVHGPAAGARALSMALRTASVWRPPGFPTHNATSTSSRGSHGVGVGVGNMERIAADRQRRKDYIVWAQVHGAALEVGIVVVPAPQGIGSGTGNSNAGSGGGYGGSTPGGTGAAGGGMVGGYDAGGMHGGMHGGMGVGVGVGVGVGGAMGSSSLGGAMNGSIGGALGVVGGGSGTAGSASSVGVGGVGTGVSEQVSSFSEMMARDAVWEADEVEWVAGMCVLRALIRVGGAARKDEYERLVRTYEGRWKEIRDEARQALVTEVLLSAKEDLARMDDGQRIS